MGARPRLFGRRRLCASHFFVHSSISATPNSAKLIPNFYLVVQKIVKILPYPHRILPNLVEVLRKGLRARFLGLEIRRNVVKDEKIL